MKVYGLTGGIGTGKSTVARMLAEEGIPVVDADLIAREIAAPGSPVHAEIVRRFGSGILLPDGGIDRKKLGGIVFADPARRAELESLTHPAIAMEIAGALGRLEADGREIAVVEAALIYEANRKGRFEAVIAVRCGFDEQVRRLMSRDGITREEALQRIGSQMDPEEKARASGIVIDNSGTIDATRAQVQAFVASLKRGRS
ncbi:MAG: dephospho-CoA kinase [Deltaproteobacteria bacterium]|nr:dephospho-CoA kinase [Deltaproteobacteria bacterium]